MAQYLFSFQTQQTPSHSRVEVTEIRSTIQGTGNLSLSHCRTEGWLW